MKKRLVIFGAIALVLVCGASFAVMRATAERRADQLFQRARGETNVNNLELWIGAPYAVYNEYPPSLGKNMASEADFQNGIKLKAYILRAMPPRFLVIKYYDATGQIVQMKVEDS